MRAFLSHSSKDKWFVGKVAEELGPLQTELDEKTFDYTFNVQAIRAALRRSDIFVYFLSRESLESTFVKEEHRATLEARGRGSIHDILIFTLDGETHKQLPSWMQEINVVKVGKSAKSCARIIQGRLLELAALEDPGIGLYIGREEDERQIRRALSQPPSKTPVFLHVVGHYGVGRRTFISNSVKKLFPRVYQTTLHVTLGQYEGCEDLYRQLYGLSKVSSFETTISDFFSFTLLDNQSKAVAIADIVRDMVSHGELLVIIDEGGVYEDGGDYQTFLLDTLQILERENQPMIAFAQTRMMPFNIRNQRTRSFHTYLKVLPNDASREILALSLKEMNVDFNETQVEGLLPLLDGHPLNLRFAVNYALNYGVQSLIEDPSGLIEYKNKRAVDFLSRITFDKVEEDLIAILSDYQFLSAAMIGDILGHNPLEITQAVRRLQDFCCIERREDYLYIAAPIREGVRRDGRFERTDPWKQKVARRVCDLLDEYKTEDKVSVSIIQTGVIAASRSDNPPEYLSLLILPSHFLKLARESYFANKRQTCIELCERAYGMRDRLPQDAQVEILRLWGLASIRNGDLVGFGKVLEKLGPYRSSAARRNASFLKGFAHRKQGRLDDAETEFLKAWNLGKSNSSVNRELAILYCKQRRYVEAESYARSAFELEPTNPYVIDAFAESLLGKQSSGLAIDKDELEDVLHKLSIYGDAPGSSFFLMRDAQQREKGGDRVGAMKVITRAIERTPNLVNPYFVRADLFLSSGQPDKAEADLHEVNRLLSEAGGFAEGDEGRAQELEIRVLLERRRYKVAQSKCPSGNILSLVNRL